MYHRMKSNCECDSFPQLSTAFQMLSNLRSPNVSWLLNSTWGCYTEFDWKGLWENENFVNYRESVSDLTKDTEDNNSYKILLR